MKKVETSFDIELLKEEYRKLFNDKLISNRTEEEQAIQRVDKQRACGVVGKSIAVEPTVGGSSPACVRYFQ